MMAFGWSGGMAPFFISLSTVRRWHLHVPCSEVKSGRPLPAEWEGVYVLEPVWRIMGAKNLLSY